MLMLFCIFVKFSMCTFHTGKLNVTDTSICNSNKIIVHLGKLNEMPVSGYMYVYVK